MKPDTPVYLSLGSNIDPEENLPKAVDLLSQQVRLIKVASTWETPPYGGGGGNYLNTAVLLYTNLAAEVLKHSILRPIEERLGRVRTEDKYAPRTIDIDIVVYGDKLLEPRVWSLPFLALPISELLPDLQDQSETKSLSEAARELLSDSKAKKRSDIHLSIPPEKSARKVVTK